MNRILTILTVAMLSSAVARADNPAQASAAPSSPGIDDGQVANLKDAKWMAPKAPEIPAGALASLVAGDPKTGPSVAYAKFPAGYHFPSHWHSHAEYTVLLSGKAKLTVDGKSHELVPGSYLVIPAKAHHEVVCGAESECVLLTRRAGAIDYHFDK